MAETPKTSIEKSIGKTDVVTTDEASRASSVLDKAVAADPVLRNAMNVEPWWQSGIMWFGTGGIVWGIGSVMTQVATHGFVVEKYNLGLMVAAIGALASPIGVLWRRFYPGLRPLFWSWTRQPEG